MQTIVIFFKLSSHFHFALISLRGQTKDVAYRIKSSVRVHLLTIHVSIQALRYESKSCDLEVVSKQFLYLRIQFELEVLGELFCLFLVCLVFLVGVGIFVCLLLN